MGLLALKVGEPTGLGPAAGDLVVTLQLCLSPFVPVPPGDPVARPLMWSLRGGGRHGSYSVAFPKRNV